MRPDDATASLHVQQVGPADYVRCNHGTWRGLVRHWLGLAALWTGRLAAFDATDVVEARRLVFVCLGNINRSAFAAAVARQLGQPAVSIGLSTTTGAFATSAAVDQASVQGVDLGPHTATAMADYVHAAGDVMMVMEVRHATALRQLGIPVDAIAFLGVWGAPMRVHLHDPHTLSADYFATCFTLIESAVRRLCHARRQAGR